jgi:hypothetical protein
MGKQMITYIFFINFNNSDLRSKGIVRAESKDLAYDKIYDEYRFKMKVCNSFEISLEEIKEIL